MLGKCEKSFSSRNFIAVDTFSQMHYHILLMCTILYIYYSIYTAEVCVRSACPNIYWAFFFSDPLLFAIVSNKVSVSLIYQATIHNFRFWTVCAAAVAPADFFLSRNLVIRVSIIFSSISLVKYVK